MSTIRSNAVRSIQSSQYINKDTIFFYSMMLWNIHATNKQYKVVKHNSVTLIVFLFPCFLLNLYYIKSFTIFNTEYTFNTVHIYNTIIFSTGVGSIFYLQNHIGGGLGLSVVSVDRVASQRIQLLFTLIKLSERFVQTACVYTSKMYRF